jgi:hypothetical protein
MVKLRRQRDQVLADQKRHLPIGPEAASSGRDG